MQLISNNSLYLIVSSSNTTFFRFEVMAPRRKITKKKKESLQTRKLLKYDPHQLKNSLFVIRSGTPISQTSKTFGVPRMTLENEIRGPAPEL